MYTKNTLREMPWYTRKFARELNALELSLERLKCMLPNILSLEIDSKALEAHRLEQSETTYELTEKAIESLF